jgi:TonB family protein
MKNVLVVAVAALALSGPASAHAFQISAPSITLVPISPAHVGIVNDRRGCDVPAAVDGTPYFEVPAIAAGQGVSGTAEVKVDITSAGSLAREELFSMSGNPWLDRAALLSARMTRFTSEVANCQHVAGSYLYEVQF